MINKILRGIDGQSQTQLDNLSKSIGDNPNILWYPSAGNDYRDILELTHERAQFHGITELPDLFIHTDYNQQFLRLTGNAHNDFGTNVRIENRFELQLIQNVQYNINPEFVDSPDDAPIEPTIYLLDISVTSKILGEVKKTIIYFLFENINFLDEVILKNNIPISFLVKVREGCGFGGNRKSISVAYAFLSILKTKYLLIDRQVQADFKIINQLKTKHNLSPLDYDLLKKGSIQWSEFNVNVFSTTYGEKELQSEKLNEILNKISQ